MATAGSTAGAVVPLHALSNWPSAQRRSRGAAGEGASDAVRPPLVHELDAYMRRELFHLGKQHHTVFDRLPVVSEVFNTLLDHFSEYRGLLSTVKREYDMAVGEGLAAVQEVHKLRTEAASQRQLYTYMIDAEKGEMGAALRQVEQRARHAEEERKAAERHLNAEACKRIEAEETCDALKRELDDVTARCKLLSDTLLNENLRQSLLVQQGKRLKSDNERLQRMCQALENRIQNEPMLHDGPILVQPQHAVQLATSSNAVMSPTVSASTAAAAAAAALATPSANGGGGGGGSVSGAAGTTLAHHPSVSAASGGSRAMLRNVAKTVTNLTRPDDDDGERVLELRGRIARLQQLLIAERDQASEMRATLDRLREQRDVEEHRARHVAALREKAEDERQERRRQSRVKAEAAAREYREVITAWMAEMRERLEEALEAGGGGGAHAGDSRGGNASGSSGKRSGAKKGGAAAKKGGAATKASPQLGQASLVPPAGDGSTADPPSATATPSAPNVSNSAAGALIALLEQLPSLLRGFDPNGDLHDASEAAADDDAAEVERRVREQIPWTPRPEWVQLETVLPNFRLERDDISSRDVLEKVKSTIKAEVDDMQVRAMTENMRKWLGKENLCDEELPGMSNKHFIGLGTGPHVPVFLRYHGLVRNKRITKGSVEDLLKEFWAKRKAEKRVEDQLETQSIQDFYFRWLIEKTGSRMQAITLAYNMVEVCEQSRADPDCGMFLSIMYGRVSEATFHDQLSLVDQLRFVVEHRDKKENRDNGKQGYLHRASFHRVLRRLFPAKSTEDMLKLRFSIVPFTDEQGFVDYVRVFEEDDDGNQTRFVELLREQHLWEINEFVVDVEEAIRRSAIVSGDKVNVAAAHNALKELDRLMPNETIDRIIAFGAKVTPEALAKLGPSHSVPSEEFLSRIRTGQLLKRHTPRDAGLGSGLSGGGGGELHDDEDDSDRGPAGSDSHDDAEDAEERELRRTSRWGDENIDYTAIDKALLEEAEAAVRGAADNLVQVPSFVDVSTLERRGFSEASAAGNSSAANATVTTSASTGGVGTRTPTSTLSRRSSVASHRGSFRRPQSQGVESDASGEAGNSS